MIFQRPDSVHVEIELPEGDSRIKEWPGGLLARGFSKMGVLLTLTTNHLLVAPLDLSSLETVLDVLGKWVPGGDRLDELADTVIEKAGLKDQAIIPLSQIVNVEKLHDASLLKPPGARVMLADGKQADFGFVATLTTPNISQKNNDIRDDFVSTIQGLIGR